VCGCVRIDLTSVSSTTEYEGRRTARERTPRRVCAATALVTQCLDVATSTDLRELLLYSTPLSAKATRPPLPRAKLNWLSSLKKRRDAHCQISRETQGHPDHARHNALPHTPCSFYFKRQHRAARLWRAQAQLRGGGACPSSAFLIKGARFHGALCSRATTRGVVRGRVPAAHARHKAERIKHCKHPRSTFACYPTLTSADGDAWLLSCPDCGLSHVAATSPSRNLRKADSNHCMTRCA
jgi:hypothetical protein